MRLLEKLTVLSAHGVPYIVMFLVSYPQTTKKSLILWVWQ